MNCTFWSGFSDYSVSASSSIEILKIPSLAPLQQLAAQLLAPNKEESILIGEDEMAAWLHYPIDTADTRVVLNGQTVAGNGNLPLPVLPGKAVESGC